MDCPLPDELEAKRSPPTEILLMISTSTASTLPGKQANSYIPQELIERDALSLCEESEAAQQSQQQPRRHAAAEPTERRISTKRMCGGHSTREGTCQDDGWDLRGRLPVAPTRSTGTRSGLLETTKR